VVALRTKLRARARELHVRVQSRELQQLERVRRGLQEGDVDVLLLADSTCLTAAVRDTDLRMIPELLSTELGGARVATISGPGFNPILHDEMLRVLSLLEQRPAAVVVSSVVRTSMAQVAGHPVYRYPEVLAALAKISDGRRRIRSIGHGARPKPEDYAAFDALEVTTTWSGPTTIGQLRHAIKGSGPHPWPLPLQKKLFDYFHGEVLAPDAPVIDAWRRFGTRLREYGAPVVAYHAPPPLEQGEKLYPGEFVATHAAKWARFKDALRSDAGERLTIVEPPFADDDFEFSPNGTEHYSFSGRQLIAETVAAALREAGISDRFTAR
jgi:hypothetical protein